MVVIATFRIIMEQAVTDMNGCEQDSETNEENTEDRTTAAARTKGTKTRPKSDEFINFCTLEGYLTGQNASFSALMSCVPQTLCVVSHQVQRNQKCWISVNFSRVLSFELFSEDKQ